MARRHWARCWWVVLLGATLLGGDCGLCGPASAPDRSQPATSPATGAAAGSQSATAQAQLTPKSPQVVALVLEQLADVTVEDSRQVRLLLTNATEADEAKRAAAARGIIERMGYVMAVSQKDRNIAADLLPEQRKRLDELTGSPAFREAQDAYMRVAAVVQHNDLLERSKPPRRFWPPWA